MGITFVGGRTQTFAGTTSSQAVALTGLTGGSDTSPSIGDFVVITYAVGSTANRTLTIGSGDYTTQGASLYANGSSYDANLLVATKYLTAADTSVSVSGTGSTASAGSITVSVYRGVDPTTPMDVAATTATGTGTGRPTPPAITPVTAGAWIAICGAAAAATGAVFIASALSDFMTATSADTQDAMVGVGDYQAWTGGAYTPAAWTGGTTGSSESWAAITLALRPYAAPAPATLPLDFTTGSLPTGVTEARTSTASYLNSSGVMAFASVDAARFDFLVSGSYAAGTPALLVEPAATNLNTNSNNFGSWGSNNSTFTANVAVAPDGTTTAGRIVPNTSYGSHNYYQGASTGISLVAASVWMKADAYGFGAITIGVDNASASYTIVVDLSNGTITSSYAGNSPGSPIGYVEYGGNGWYRLVVSAQNVTTNTCYMSVSPSNSGTPTFASNGDATFAGDGTSGILIAASQKELGPKATSYIATTSSAVTRSADAISFTIPDGVTSLTYTFDDSSTQDMSVSAGAYTVPMNLNRTRIRTIAVTGGASCVYRGVSWTSRYKGVRADSSLYLGAGILHA